MTRKPLSDGRWFDMDRADKLATSRNRDDFRWCDLYKTAGGSYVFANITCWQGERDSFEPTTPQSAAEFMIKCGNELPEDLATVAESYEA